MGMFARQFMVAARAGGELDCALRIGLGVAVRLEIPDRGFIRIQAAYQVDASGDPHTAAQVDLDPFSENSRLWNWARFFPR